MAKEDKRIQFLKQDGTDLFTEGDIVGATGLYVTAMQLETELAIQALSCPNENEENAKVFEDNNNNNMAKNESSSQSTKNSTEGMKHVLEAVLEQADEAIRVNPCLPKAYLSKASVLLLQNKWDEARDVYNKGINSCENCEEIRKALRKLYRTQSLLKSIPAIIQRTGSLSSDISECTSEGLNSPSWKNKRFRIQHRKKLSRPRVEYALSSTSSVLFESEDISSKANNTKHESQENLLVDTTNKTE